jgi:hypothetical protein
LKRTDAIASDFQKTIRDSDELVLQEKDDLTGIRQNVNAILIQGGLIAGYAEEAAVNEKAHWAKMLSTADELEAMTETANQHLNNELLPHADQAIQKLTFTLGTVDEAVSSLSKSGNDTLQATTESIHSLNAQFNDPQIGLLIGNLNLTALHMASSTEHANNIIAYYDNRLTSPKGFLRTIGAGLFSLIVPGAEVYTAVATGTAGAGVATGTAVAKQIAKKRKSSKP